ncbi:MAG: GNAT family N-acetyltransferase [Acidobacteriales bacterium]|nr:GNAT family N-acetyltransferase [Terriglobales bacterium]
MSFRAASRGDIPRVLPLMRDFCEFEKLWVDETRRTALLELLIDDGRSGRLVLIETEGQLAGYFVMGFGFSIEFGGRDAILDELYVAPEFRNRGLGTRAIEHAFEICRELGIACLHLEADYFNERAHQLYLRHGFKDHERHLMTKWL